MLWRDRQGRFSWIKAAALAVAIVPALWMAYKLGAGKMGVKPIEAAIHQTGTWCLRFLLLTLAVTPARIITGWNRLIAARRILGVASLCYALAHVGFYTYDQKLDLVRVVIEIALRFYLTIGFVALAALVALGLTSRDAAVKRLGAATWQKLHRLVYPATALGIFHGFLQAKIDVSPDVVLAGRFLALVGVRLMRGRIAIHTGSLLALALAAALAAGVLELLWYALATGVNWRRVFDANFMMALQPRPALEVFAIALALPALALVARIAARLTRPLSKEYEHADGREGARRG
jgi:sulfoxide reductase heme-binding subunit YedZ